EALLERSLGQWIERAHAESFKGVLQKYRALVKEHVAQLDEFILKEDITSVELSNRVMKAFLDETEDTLRRCGDPEVKDAYLLMSVQGINHYKISAYGTAAAFANALGMFPQATVFHKAEVNEKQIDDRLSQLAEYEINAKAKAPILIK
ncbi:MAG: ferritin-like domain-containing protein, partial [Chitinophagaceae bacterium]